MDDNQLRAWILEQAKCVENGQQVEDNRIELKAAWIEDHHKAARQIAGLINAAMSRHVLWIVGLDEERGAVGAEQEEMSEWWPQVKKRFEGVPPNVYTASVSHKEKNLIGLLFETTVIPCVIKSKDSGSPALEVPWREGNSTQSARQADLQRLFSAIPTPPKIEAVSGNVTLFPENSDIPPEFRALRYAIQLQLFINKRQTGIITLPIHRCKLLLRSRYDEKIGEARKVEFSSSSREAITCTPNEVYISGSGTLVLEAKVFISKSDYRDIRGTSSPKVVITLKLVEVDEEITLEAFFKYDAEIDPGPADAEFTLIKENP